MNYLVFASDINENATGICTYYVCKELSNRGNYVYIINPCDNEKRKEDGSLIIQNVYTVLFKRIMSYFKKKGYGKISYILNRLYATLIQLKSLFSLTPPFSQSSIYCKEAYKACLYTNFDLIIAIVNPMETIEAAKKISRRLSIPYCAYFLDAIYASNGIKLLSRNYFQKKALKYEEKYLCDSIRVFMMNSARKLYENTPKEARFYDKIEFADIPMLLQKPQIIKKEKIYWTIDEFVILFIGTMPRNIRDPRFCFSVLNSVAKEDVHVYFVGSCDYKSDFSSLLKHNSNIHYLGYVDHKEIPTLLSQANILLNIGNSITTMTPSKIFEYMSYDKPIITTVKNKKDPTKSYLRCYTRYLEIDEAIDCSDAVTMVQEFISMMQNDNFQSNNSIEDLSKEGGPLYMNTPAYICDKIDHCIKEYRK